MVYEIIELGTSVHGYMSSILSVGPSLTRRVLKVCDLKQGKTVTLLPPETDKSALTKFWTGGIASRDESIRSVVAFLRDQVLRYPRTQILFEDRCSTVGDPPIAGWQSCIATYEGEVYFIGSSADSNERLMKLLIKSATSNETSFQVFTPPVGFLLIPKELSSEEINILATNCVTIVVSAYDGEGFVIWTKKSLSNSNSGSN